MDAVTQVLSLNFFISLPVLVISAAGQWVIQFRLIFNHTVTLKNGLLCILLTQISVYVLSLIIWLLWPLDPNLVMYHNRISVPAVSAEILLIPLWMRYFGYLHR